MGDVFLDHPLLLSPISTLPTGRVANFLAIAHIPLLFVSHRHAPPINRTEIMKRLFSTHKYHNSNLAWSASSIELTN